ncbi:MAG: DUF1302 family protein [Bdellovibrionales bacterium]
MNALLGHLLITLSLLATPFACTAHAAAKKTKPLSLKKRLSPSGSLRTGVFEHDKQYSEDTGFLLGSAWLSIKTRRVLGVGLYAEGNLQASNLTRQSTSYGDLREAYTFGNMKKWDLKLGRQIIVWGRADKLNPTDSLSVRDLTRLVVDDEDQRTGILSAQQTYTSGYSRLIAIWQPEWRAPKIPIPPLPQGVRVSTKDPSSPTSQFALKFDRSGGRYDYSVSYFNGYDKNPDLELVSIGAGGIDLNLEHNAVQVFGADTAFNRGDFGIRAELAYTKTGDNGGDDPLMKNSFWYLVMGADHSFSENTNLNVQYLYRHIEDWVDPNSLGSATNITLAKEAQLLFNQRQEQQHGFSTRLLRRFWDQTLDAELSVLMWLQKQDSLLRAKLIYSFSDHWKGYLGAEIFSGPDDSYLGQSKKISSLFSEIRYSF